MVLLPKPVVVYKSLNQVWNALAFNKDLPEVRGIINLCLDIGLFHRRNNNLEPNSDLVLSSVRDRDNVAFPFIVVEGLDGTGKTTLTRFLSSTLNMRIMGTPPKNFEVFIKARDFFDGQPESIRRAYYSLGNYIAAHDFILSKQPAVMDRYWHSTSAYAMAHQLRSEPESFEKSDLIWPADLLQPDLVVFLQVSEKERLRRHSTRKEFTNTKEEQTLAEDSRFRFNLVECYRSVVGPPMAELFVDGEQPDSEAKIMKAVLNAFPSLKEKSKVKI
ncbi:UMP-CMP kinase 2, mitochondrial [Orchesella cincta]|uniref:UMP-CMP kinase 2, mitochondrial n=1 Tax=Orchesella cincta TaxID=48709 RepID=A0A1D2N9J4_ORCCI|nr:UMP-CMP kinase 2, mitochondrial [Orchesella cincta]